MKYTLLFTVLFAANGAMSQEDSLILDLKIKDTSTYNGRDIIVFNDNSWEYADDFKVVEISKAVSKSGLVTFDHNELFNKNWKTTRTVLNAANCRLATDTITLDVSGCVKPVNASINSGFKFRWNRWHQGNDIAASVGTNVKACWGGKVRYAQFNTGGFGNLIIIRHYNGLESYYAHLSMIHVKINDTVSPGQLIGKVGNTGHSTGPHLHWEIRFLDSPMDPSLFLNKQTIEIHSGLFPANNSTGPHFKFKDKLGLSSVVEEKNETVIKVKKNKTRKTFSTVN